jgi:hypothetical protein
VPVSPHVRSHGTIRLPLDGFSRNLVVEYFSKICQKFHVLSNSDKNNEQFTHRIKYLYGKISLNLSDKGKCFRKYCRENQNTFYVQQTLFFLWKSRSLWDKLGNMIESDKTQMPK